MEKGRRHLAILGGAVPQQVPPTGEREGRSPSQPLAGGVWRRLRSRHTPPASSGTQVRATFGRRHAIGQTGDTC